MIGIIIIMGLILGVFLSKVINIISLKIDYKKEKKKIGLYEYLIIFITCTMVLISFLKFGLGMVLFKAVLLDCILIVTSFIDFKYWIIPNKIVILTLIIGISFSFICDISFLNAIIGMLVGGSILFILGFMPNGIGGGDIKWMFALGAFLGTKKILVAVCIAFICASIISSLLLIFKIKGRKDYIPLGPFLAIGCFLSFHITFLL